MHCSKSKTGHAMAKWEQKISSVLELLDTRLDPREVEKARDVQMSTLVEKDFAKPRLKSRHAAESEAFQFQMGR